MDDCDIVGPHLDSFNYFVDEGLDKAIADIDAEEFQVTISGDLRTVVKLKIHDVKISAPSSSKEDAVINMLKVYPSECRQRGITYGGKMRIRVGMTVGSKELDPIDRMLGEFPVMVKSKLCNLYNLPTREIVRRGEEEREMGGYFIVNGTEKILRLLIVNRRNYPMAITRNGWKKRGSTYTEFGIFMRCVRDNHTATMNTLHYLMTRRMMLCFLYRKEMFFVPILEILRALVDDPELCIYESLMCGRETDNVWEKSVKNMLKDLHDDGLLSQTGALRHMGQSFRVSLQAPDWWTDVEVGRSLLKKCVLIHLNDCREKFNLLCYMAQKLRAFVCGECREDDPDNIMFHEVAMPGHILLMMMKEKFENWLQRLRRQIEEDAKKKGLAILGSTKGLSDSVKAAMKFDVCRVAQYFLATGTLSSVSGLGLQQVTGFSIIAERLNYLRFVSHFRGIHRGAFFTTMRATDVRKLRPEAWGFLCPVHTPDGTPCGLLNHLTAACRVVGRDPGPTHLRALVVCLSTLGLLSPDEFRSLAPINGGNSGAIFPKENVDETDTSASDFRPTDKGGVGAAGHLPVLADGRFLGWATFRDCVRMASFLRARKIFELLQTDTTDQGMDASNEVVPAGPSAFFDPYAEVILVPRPSKSTIKSLYPGLYIFTSPARFMRPVKSLVHNGHVEFIGTMEQVYLSVCIEKSEAIPGATTHQELNPHSFLSFVANLIPFSDHNQSPRNVYQCQMGKQTMGIPSHRMDRRVDNKMYKLQTPQTPLVRPFSYDQYGVDDYPLGTNAIVAVISYTGYDMEDSMVINKTSFERGFAHASVLKCERINLMSTSSSKRQQQAADKLMFSRDPANESLQNFMDPDGLPYIGKLYNDGDPVYCYVSLSTGKYVTKPYHHTESAHVDQIKICGGEANSSELNHVCITWSAARNPSMGDKFASRHGQKGMMSFLWPTENMPFTESGMVPDIIFNPHGFPSRMTVGMMIEFMAGKSAALHSLSHNAAPFIFSEDKPAVKYFGDSLVKAGYNYLGNEPLYSGVDGREMKADIFFGVVYYQKLRHMVEDKYQVRSTGPVDELTGQPVHGRKRGGGVRFGEMERDALISHGCAFLLQDRLFNCSDKDYAQICRKCGCSMGVYKQAPPTLAHRPTADSSTVSYCRLCNTADHVKVLAVPTVLKLLVAELNCLNIKTKFEISSS